MPLSAAPKLSRIARLPKLRALAWSDDVLYASRGYDLVRAKIDSNFQLINWQSVATFNPGWKRKLSSAHPLTTRLFRDGFHALAAFHPEVWRLLFPEQS